MNPKRKITDANEACASIAYKLSEVVAIYPITPSSPMAEHCDEWAAESRPNLFGTVPDVVEMQSEGGAAGVLHGALQSGALATSFTASQGLLLMIPNLYKIAGELHPFCLHVTARTLASHALSIFGDHQDIMACRQTGFALLASNNVQEAQDMAAVGHAASLESRVPFIHFFDGFRTSHEINTYTPLTDDQLRAFISLEAIAAHRNRALTPDKPQIRGTAQNPDVFFQAREACNPFYSACPTVVQNLLERFASITGRHYKLFEYSGAPDAEEVIIIIGSGAETCEETSRWLNNRGAKTGVLKVRLLRPFSLSHFVAALPRTVRSIAVLDRTKEPGAIGEPLYMDIRVALEEARDTGLWSESSRPKIIGGRYGISSKEFTPAMVRAVYDELKKSNPKRIFTVGINDDISFLSLNTDESFTIEPPSVKRAVFFGLGADGTVGANKNSVKIIGEETDFYAQAYFVYDSKKSGSMTVSHLRFGPEPIRAPYLIREAQFVGCHQFIFMDRYDVVSHCEAGGILLLNTLHDASSVWNHLPEDARRQIRAKGVRLFIIDAAKVARSTGMGARINTIMQTCYFAISGILPRDEAIAKIKEAVAKTYGRKGESVVRKNWEAIDHTLANLFEVKIPDVELNSHSTKPTVSPEAPDFVRNVTAMMLSGLGDRLPVSAFAPDGTFPTNTARWEKRSIAASIPVWEPDLCIQCNKCVFVCPHSAIRAKFYPDSLCADAPDGFRHMPFKSRDNPNHAYTLQVAPEDCTGCELCVTVCPVKDKSNPSRKAINMAPQAPLVEKERVFYDHFLKLPEPNVLTLDDSVKGTQFRQPLFEYSGACSGCGETPYIKLLTQLYGDRLVIANATGCSSIYGGNLPTTPYAQNHEGRGPAWSNSLFEDNAEYGLGMRVAIDRIADRARWLLTQCAPAVGDELTSAILNASQTTEQGILEQRGRVMALRERLSPKAHPHAAELLALGDYLVRKTVWIIGGDGWAYDIGYGGLDHVIASGRDVNILVLDTGVYSNTGGQQSKATPLGAVAKFATNGKSAQKKDLGLLLGSYGNAYVAQVAFGAKDSQTVQAFTEAESYNGPSLIIAYSHCIAHGYNMSAGLDQQKLAVSSGFFPLYRNDPRRAAAGEPALKLDSPAPKTALSQFMENEARFRMLMQRNPERSRELTALSQEQLRARYALYEKLASKSPNTD